LASAIQYQEKKPVTGQQLYSAGTLGLYLKQINNKLKISGNVLDIVPNDILKVPKNPMVHFKKSKMASKIAAALIFFIFQYLNIIDG